MPEPRVVTVAEFILEGLTVVAQGRPIHRAVKEQVDDDRDFIEEWAIEHDLEPDSFREVMREVAKRMIDATPISIDDLTDEQIVDVGNGLQSLVLMGCVFGAAQQKRIIVNAMDKEADGSSD